MCSLKIRAATDWKISFSPLAIVECRARFCAGHPSDSATDGKRATVQPLPHGCSGPYVPIPQPCESCVAENDHEPFRVAWFLREFRNGAYGYLALMREPLHVSRVISSNGVRLILRRFARRPSSQSWDCLLVGCSPSVCAYKPILYRRTKHCRISSRHSSVPSVRCFEATHFL